MTPVRFWIGLVLVALGTLGVLDATGAMESSQFIEDWWPLGLLGLGLVIAFSERRLSFGSGALILVGLGLFVERQDWAREELVWPLVLVAAGAAVLLGRARRDSAEGRSETPAPRTPVKTA